MINLIYLDLSCLNLNHNGTNTLYALHNLIYLTHLDIHNTSLDNNSQYNTLYWLSTLTSLTYLNLANINYNICNIGSGVNTSASGYPTGNMPQENRFKYHSNADSYTAIPCYANPNNTGTYYFPSLNSSGAAISASNSSWYYYPTTIQYVI